VFLSEHDPEKWEPVFGTDHAQPRWRSKRAGATGDPNNSGVYINTSSIMLCNAPSIMQREATGITPG
jgi:hypothetical protein